MPRRSQDPSSLSSFGLKKPCQSTVRCDKANTCEGTCYKEALTKELRLTKNIQSVAPVKEFTEEKHLPRECACGDAITGECSPRKRTIENREIEGRESAISITKCRSCRRIHRTFRSTSLYEIMKITSQQIGGHGSYLPSGSVFAIIKDFQGFVFA